MDISNSMENLLKKYINIIIQGILSNLNYQLNQIHYLPFSSNLYSYNYYIDQYKSSIINSGSTTLILGPFEK